MWKLNNTLIKKPSKRKLENTQKNEKENTIYVTQLRNTERNL